MRSALNCVQGLAPARRSRRAAGYGAIAQLGERLHGMQEVGGSIPPGSTRLRASPASARQAYGRSCASEREGRRRPRRSLVAGKRTLTPLMKYVYILEASTPNTLRRYHRRPARAWQSTMRSHAHLEIQAWAVKTYVAFPTSKGLRLRKISESHPAGHLRRSVSDALCRRRRPHTTRKTPMTSQTAPGAMTGLRVIDLTRVLGGPYCTQILADHGADVIKVEPPAGDEVRDWGPPFHDDDAAYFVGINRNKRSIGLDLASEGGRDGADEDAGERRRPDREFQAGHARQMGHRQRRAAREISAADPLPDFRLRRRRPARRQSRL